MDANFATVLTSVKGGLGLRAIAFAETVEI